VIQLVATRMLVNPVLDGVEHVALDFDAIVSQGWMVEGSQDIVDDLVHGHARVLPGIEDASGQVSILIVGVQEDMALTARYIGESLKRYVQHRS
jgi:hypothetical protein